jgi:hypothetical protein
VQTGECPDGTQAGADTSCSGQGTWQQTANRTIFDPVHTEADPDGIAEPVVNADRAALAADAGGNPPPVDTAPTVSITSPSPGSTVSGSAATVSGTSGDDHGVTQVQVLVDGTSIGTTTPGAGGAWSLPWNTTTASNGSHSLVARATDTVGHTTNSSPVSVTVSNAAPTPVLHVGELLGSATPGRKWTATATVRVVDGSGAPVSGATVQVSVASTAALAAAGGKPPPGGSGALSCVTGTDGRCSVSTKPSTTAVRFTVTGVTKSGWTYDATKNVDADTSTSQTDVVVRKP